MLTTFGLFPTTADAERTLALWMTQLLEPENLSVVLQKRMLLLHMAQYDRLDQVQRAGVIRRAPLDRLAGMLVGVGATAVPGLGAILSAGPLAQVVSHASAGLVAALVRAHMPAGAARELRDGLRRGDVLLALHDAPEGPALMAAARVDWRFHGRLQLNAAPSDHRAAAQTAVGGAHHRPPTPPSTDLTNEGVP